MCGTESYVFDLRLVPLLPLRWMETRAVLPKNPKDVCLLSFFSTITPATTTMMMMLLLHFFFCVGCNSCAGKKSQKCCFCSRHLPTEILKCWYLHILRNIKTLTSNCKWEWCGKERNLYPYSGCHVVAVAVVIQILLSFLCLLRRFSKLKGF